MVDSSMLIYPFIFLFSLLITAFSLKKLIPILRKKAEQPIYLEGPSWHQSKTGTPTMGGLSFLPSFLIFGFMFFILLVVNNKDSALSLLSILLFALGNALTGIIDDLSKIKRKENQGLTPRQKLLIQTALSLLFLSFRTEILHESTSLFIFSKEIPLGLIYYPLMLILLLGTVNCANLTDGIDGLSASVAFAIAVSFLLLSGKSNTVINILSILLMSISVGFLIFNLHPAKIFMGDTGSLFIGGLVGGLIFELHSPFSMLFVGVVYVLEGVSVILQVFYYKLTKKRIFLMAPIHHHLEKKGFSENAICMFGMILTLLFACILMLIR